MVSNIVTHHTIAGPTTKKLRSRGGGEEAICLHMEVGEFPSLGGDFTKIILMRATVVRPKSGENK